MKRKAFVPDPDELINPVYFKTENRVTKFREVISRRQNDLHLILEDVFDPHNVSAVLRTCDSVGVGEVHLVYVEEEFPVFNKKSSSGTWKWIKSSKYDTIESCFKKLKNAGVKIYTTDLNENSKSIYDVDFTVPIAIVFGNEHKGVSRTANELSDGNINIPMNGLVESLNISVACAVTLYEVFRQRDLKEMYKNNKSNEEIERTLKEWLFRTSKIKIL
ncbi:MAG: RNA methyltransferase [Chlorobiota bacterium]|jgi:tRNA (guanosine-2'-O-)-methyltransferase|nr:RNA methyltransferase [Chlorobiota bacterium]QQS65883.1 MAG: RNA methyltransferase [Chlorobiota bacterium]